MGFKYDKWEFPLLNEQIINVGGFGELAYLREVF